MEGSLDIATGAALLGDPARAAMLALLLDGRAHTAGELAAAAGITPPTASGHLARLLEGGLLAVERRGRFRHFRLAAPEVAHALEALMELARIAPPRHRPSGPREHALREARSCYDHLAGRYAVALAETMLARGLLHRLDDAFLLPPAGLAFLTEAVGVVLPPRGPRAFCRCCLDWTERRPHLGGALGAALLARFLALGWLGRRPGTRALDITAAGRAGFARLCGAVPAAGSAAPGYPARAASTAPISSRIAGSSMVGGTP